MTSHKSHSRFNIVRSSMKKDLFYFAIPAFIVFIFGLQVTAWDGWEGFWGILWNMIIHPSIITTRPVLNTIGIFMTLIGLIICFVGAFTLGMAYSSSLVIREGHKLITHGIYRIVRHPIYLGALITLIGIPVSAQSWRGLLIMLLLVPFILIRIRLEEKLLTEHFGDAYRDYKKKVKKLVPFIY